MSESCCVSSAVVRYGVHMLQWLPSVKVSLGKKIALNVTLITISREVVIEVTFKARECMRGLLPYKAGFDVVSK